jgi:hypothetical protein
VRSGPEPQQEVRSQSAVGPAGPQRLPSQTSEAMPPGHVEAAQMATKRWVVLKAVFSEDWQQVVREAWAAIVRKPGARTGLSSVWGPSLRPVLWVPGPVSARPRQQPWNSQPPWHGLLPRAGRRSPPVRSAIRPESQGCLAQSGARSRAMQSLTGEFEPCFWNFGNHDLRVSAG